jgi:hypothetical protein
MANPSASGQYSDRKRSQIQSDEAARLEKLQLMCGAIDTRSSKWRYPPQSSVPARETKASLDD